MAKLDLEVREKLKIQAAKDALVGEMSLPSSEGRIEKFLLKWFFMFVFPPLGIGLQMDECERREFMNLCDAYYEKQYDKYRERIIDDRINSKIQDLLDADDPDYDELDDI